MARSRTVLLLAIIGIVVALTLVSAEQPGSDPASRMNVKLGIYRTWLLDNGALMKNLEFNRVAGHGITVTPPKDLKRGASLAFIPKALVVTTATVQLSHAAQYYTTESPLHLSALWLLEQVHDADSFWKPYVDILPRHLSMSIFWPEDEYLLIKPIQLFGWTEKRLATIKTKFRALFSPSNRKADFPESLSWMSKVTESEWQWALGIMWSRGLPSDPKYEGNLVLIPIEDMFAIMSPQSVEPQVRVRMKTDGIEFVSNTDIAKGSVIEKLEPAARKMTNPELAFQYGTVFETNKNDRLTFPSCAAMPDKVVTDKQKQLLKSARCDATEFHLKHGDDLKDFLCSARIIAMDEEEIANATMVSRAQGRRMISPLNEYRATSCLIEMAVRVRDAFYPSDWEKVQKLLNDDKFGYKALPPARRRTYHTISHAISTATKAYFQGQRLNRNAGAMVDGRLAFPPIHETIGRKLKPEPVTDFPADDATATTSLPLSLHKREQIHSKQRAEKRAAMEARRKEREEAIAANAAAAGSTAAPATPTPEPEVVPSQDKEEL